MYEGIEPGIGNDPIPYVIPGTVISNAVRAFSVQVQGLIQNINGSAGIDDLIGDPDIFEIVSLREADVLPESSLIQFVPDKDINGPVGQRAKSVSSSRLHNRDDKRHPDPGTPPVRRA